MCHALRNGKSKKLTKYQIKLTTINAVKAVNLETKRNLSLFNSRLKTKCYKFNIRNSQQMTDEFNLSSVWDQILVQSIV